MEFNTTKAIVTGGFVFCVSTIKSTNSISIMFANSFNFY